MQKILELEQKLKGLEHEKMLYGPSKGFINSSNVLNVNFNSTVAPTNHNNRTSNVYSYNDDLKHPENQIKKKLNQTTKVETHYTKKFNFRSNVIAEKKKSSSTLTAFELRRQMFNSSKNNWTQPVDSQDLSENGSFVQNHLDQSEKNDTTLIKSNKSAKLNHSVVKKNSPNPKRKRLFDPNNYDYLDSNHF